MILARIVSSVAVCCLGSYSMWLTKNRDDRPIGIGWAVLGLFIIWSV